LALTKRRESFQILHATLLLIGGVRRPRPEFCRRAISSFPLHGFYNDGISLGIGLDAAQVIDVVKVGNIENDSISLGVTLDSFILTDIIKTRNELETIQLSANLVAVSLIAINPQLDARSNETISLATQLINVSLLQVVIPVQAPRETISISLQFTASLEV